MQIRIISKHQVLYMNCGIRQLIGTSFICDIKCNPSIFPLQRFKRNIIKSTYYSRAIILPTIDDKLISTSILIICCIEVCIGNIRHIL